MTEFFDHVADLDHAFHGKDITKIGVLQILLVKTVDITLGSRGK